MLPVQTALGFTTLPPSLPLGSTTAFTASITAPGAQTATGTVTFLVGNTTLGSAVLSGGIATLNAVTISTANCFTIGSTSLTAHYSGDATFAAATADTTLTVGPVPTYTLSASQTAIAGSSTINLAVASTDYAGTVTFAVSVSSPTGQAANINASAPPATLQQNGNATSVLTITANSSAAKRLPGLPWKASGSILFATLLVGVPFTRRKRATAVLLAFLTITAAGVLMSCGGGHTSTSTPQPARIYTVMVTPQGSGAVTNPPPVSITLTLQ